MATPDKSAALAADADPTPENVDTLLPENNPADAGIAPDVPNDFKDLADLAKEIEPRLKEGDTIARGPDGKFLPKTPAAEEGSTGPTGEAEAASGATGPVPSGTTEAATGPSGATGRDADLDTSKLDPHLRAPTRKVIEGYAQKAKEARDRLDAIQQEHKAAQAKLQEAEEKLKTIKAPKEMEDELATLRARVRELDISKDPAIQQKYDARIKSNSETALGLLKDQGIFKLAPAKDGEEPKEMSETQKKALTSELEKGGFGIRGMARYISALEKAGEYEAAERLRQVASQNDQLARDKDEEIATWAKDFEGFQAEKQRETQEAHQAYLGSVKEAGERELQTDLTALTKQFPYLSQPPAPLPSDTRDVAAAKQKALDEYNVKVAQLGEAVKTFSAEGLPPEKAAVAYGKLQSHAVQAVILKQHVLPRLLKENEAAVARVKELEGELGKLRKAGALNKAHSAAITAPVREGRAPSAELSLEEAAKQVAAEMGLKVD